MIAALDARLAGRGHPHPLLFPPEHANASSPSRITPRAPVSFQVKHFWN